MHALGIRVNPSSRFRVYQAVLERAAKGEPVDERNRAQAHLEVAQLVEIGRGLLFAPTPAVIRKLQQVVGDPILPGGSRSQVSGATRSSNS
jgi:hypothetical protein